ncbi:DEAD box protein/DEAH protein box helicase, partial [Aphelenchoides avenae]
QQKQERLLQGRPHIVVATPGRLWALMESAPTDHTLGDLSALKLFVVDEIDRMVERGHFDELEMIIRRVKDLDNTKCQTLVFSATLTFVHTQYTRKNGQKGVVLTPEDKLKRLVQAAGIRKERKVIDISQKTTVPTTLVEKRMNCADLLQKDATVYYLLKRYPGRTLIFTNSIDAARRLRGILVKLQLEPPAQILHARMIEKKRLKNLERFTESENSVLISTDVAARGLDIKGVKNVVHYQVPKTAE